MNAHRGVLKLTYSSCAAQTAIYRALCPPFLDTLCTCSGPRVFDVATLVPSTSCVEVSVAPTHSPTLQFAKTGLDELNTTLSKRITGISPVDHQLAFSEQLLTVQLPENVGDSG
jgi:hypothetical protein